MISGKKILVSAFVISFVGLGLAATTPPPEPKWQNLKVLPKNISHEDLDHVMDAFKNALGVKCNFCHAPSKDSTNHHLDFASDEKPEKNIARNMMRMTGKINKKFFNYSKADQEQKKMPPITCVTCHRGSPHPDEVK